MWVASKATISYSVEQRGERKIGLLEKQNSGKWSLVKTEGVEPKEKPFGAGMHEFSGNTFSLKRTDKKKYLFKSNDVEKELSVSAAIYEAYELHGELVVRIGNRTIAFFDTNMKKIQEIKEKENIGGIAPGENSLFISLKGEVKGYSYQGELQWKYSSIPKPYGNQQYWVPSRQCYIWSVHNDIEHIVATISEKGEIINSQSFGSKEYHRDMIISPQNQCFIAQTNGSIECYEMQ
ncbi:hypothetical protein GLW08_06850 [Pontibacillus yanchengensis]|uniref:Uncharacterized protein n=1 Tax=Pontibacillus yanchengensis TaxID=462910 RepID=A0ACC7VEM3_9BACI|nr:hypothetical protein [Pontibacillus yanchengensis]MYL53055.1 hypothetical protein [Pontibacillus yanchengensis]